MSYPTITGTSPKKWLVISDSLHHYISIQLHSPHNINIEFPKYTNIKYHKKMTFDNLSEYDDIIGHSQGALI